MSGAPEVDSPAKQSHNRDYTYSLSHIRDLSSVWWVHFVSEAEQDRQAVRQPHFSLRYRRGRLRHSSLFCLDK